MGPSKAEYDEESEYEEEDDEDDEDDEDASSIAELDEEDEYDEDNDEEYEKQPGEEGVNKDLTAPQRRFSRRKSNPGPQGLPRTQRGMSQGSSNVSGSNQYVQVAPLPIFKGEEGECPASHVAKFSRVCKANNAATPEMWIRLFPVSLEGEAALWYEFNVEGKQLTWDEIKMFFIQTFRRSENVDQLRVDLSKLRIGPRERVSAFFLRMQCILRKWPNNGLPDSFLKGFFIDGLKEDCQDWVILRNPPDLRAAVLLALQWEEAQNIKAGRKCNDSGKQIEPDALSCNAQKPNASAFGWQEAESFKGRLQETGQPLPPIWCFGCRVRMHDECECANGPVEGPAEKIKAGTCRFCEGLYNESVCQQKQPCASKCGFCEGDHEECTCEVRQLMKELWKNSTRKINIPAGDRPFASDRESTVQSVQNPLLGCASFPSDPGIPSTVRHIQKPCPGCGSVTGDQDAPSAVKTIHNPLYQCTSCNCAQEMPCMNIERLPVHCCYRCWLQHLNSEPQLPNHSCICACFNCNKKLLCKKIGMPIEHCCCMCSTHNLNYKSPLQRM